jgi:hypothetical protein
VGAGKERVMSDRDDRRADRNRRKREQQRARYDTPRETADPTPAQRRLQLAANLSACPASQLPPEHAEAYWALRHDLLAALDAVHLRTDATAPLRVYVARFFGIDQPPEHAAAIAAGVGVEPTTVWNNLQRAYGIMRAWVATTHPELVPPAPAVARPPSDPLFWSKVDGLDDPDGCWLWTGATDMGFGVLKRGGKKQQAHRYAYALLRGPLTEGYHLTRTCAQRRCVNPAHFVEALPGYGAGAEGAAPTEE